MLWTVFRKLYGEMGEQDNVLYRQRVWAGYLRGESLCLQTAHHSTHTHTPVCDTIKSASTTGTEHRGDPQYYFNLTRTIR